jgi:magnesium chelatase subunit D
MTTHDDQAANPWLLPLLAIELVRAQPRLCNGIWLKSAAGAARDAWWQSARQRWSDVPSLQRVQRIPSSVGVARLLGEIDITASVISGKRQATTGLLQTAADSIAVVSMAERMDASIAAVISQLLDGGLDGDHASSSVGRSARPLLILEDESEPAEHGPPISLTSRVGMVIKLPPSINGLIDARNEVARLVAASRAELDSSSASDQRAAIADQIMVSAAEFAHACGVDDARHLRHAIECMRAHAWCRGSDQVEPSDAIIGTALVVAPRATRLPQPESEQAPNDDQAQREPNPPANADANEPEPSDPPEDQEAEDENLPNTPIEISTNMLIEACAALLPEGLLNFKEGVMRNQGLGGSSGPQKVRATQRGRPLASRPGGLRSGKRLDLYATLIAAAPWQRVRARERSGATGTERVNNLRMHLRPSDFRLKRFEQKSATTAIFVIDASGSAAIARLAEAKGAVELMLADCYVRRDEVAVVSFRGRSAEIVVPPTRSLTLVKRSLSALPGGGGTPLATALDTAHALAVRVARGGATPLIVLLSDGRANITRSGEGDRQAAQSEANQAAQRIAVAGVHSLVIDTSARGDAQAKRVAVSMCADYLCLPNAESRLVSEATRRAVDQVKAAGMNPAPARPPAGNAQSAQSAQLAQSARGAARG